MSFIKELSKDIGSIVMYVGLTAGLAATSGCTNYQKTQNEKNVELYERNRMLNRECPAPIRYAPSTPYMKKCK